jgi:hypothetical protein
MFPDPKDFLTIRVNAKGPAPPCGALESLLETSVFSNPIFGIPFEKPVTGQTELTRATSAIAHIAGRSASRSRPASSAGHSCAVRDRG